MRKLGVAPKAKDIVAELPPATNWLEIVGELLQRYQSGPMFSVYSSAAQSIPHGVWTKLSFDQKEWDVTNAFNITNSRFQPSVAGYYHVHGNYVTAGTAGANGIAVYKNALQYKLGVRAGTAYWTSAKADVYLNGSTDYVELWVYQDSGVAANTNASSAATYFQGHLIRPA